MKFRKILKYTLATALILFILFNGIMISHAYHFTEYFEKPAPESDFKKMLLGRKIPRMRPIVAPKKEFESFFIPVNDTDSLSAWSMKTDSIPKGLVILLHGYTGDKTWMLDHAYIMLDLGYDVLLPDFMGAGDSHGTYSTVGYEEAEDVKASYDYVSNKGGYENIFLSGFSMGAAAILKAQSDYNMDVKGLIIEASYGTFEETVAVRMNLMGFPAEPFTSTLMFWGGMMRGFDAHEMKPDQYARNVTTPSLVMCGGKDQYIPKSETQRIYDNLASKHKELYFWVECIHESYFGKYKDEWIAVVSHFLEECITEKESSVI